MERAIEIVNWFGEHSDNDDVKRMFTDYVESKGISDMEIGAENLRKQIIAEQMDEDLKRVIPLSYIAKYYFKKSAAWLSQRINGTPVRGKVYTLSGEQKETFNRAMRELGQKIGSFQIA
ncbi:MAG: DUF5053 domain-containing protein [Prevotella sp.]|nr:DUF5053 domain-containing protein [Prevotella sp.]